MAGGIWVPRNELDKALGSRHANVISYLVPTDIWSLRLEEAPLGINYLNGFICSVASMSLNDS